MLSFAGDLNLTSIVVKDTGLRATKNFPSPVFTITLLQISFGS